MTLQRYDIQRVMSVLFAALLVFAFVTPVCVTMACSMSGMAPTATDMSHAGGMNHSTSGVSASGSSHASHQSISDCMRGFTSHSGLIGMDSLTLAAILVVLSLMGLATARTPLQAAGHSRWMEPLRVPSPPPPLSPLGVRLSV